VSKRKSKGKDHNTSAAGCAISFKFGKELDHVTADKCQTFSVKRSNVKITAWRDVLAVIRYKSETDKLTDFKNDENYPSAERNMRQTFNSNRPKIEIWQIVHLYTAKSLIVELLLSLIGVAESNGDITFFDSKLRNTSFCACAVKMWPIRRYIATDCQIICSI